MAVLNPKNVPGSNRGIHQCRLAIINWQFIVVFGEKLPILIILSKISKFNTSILYHLIYDVGKPFIVIHNYVVFSKIFMNP
jgi:hypothetical protein